MIALRQQDFFERINNNITSNVFTSLCQEGQEPALVIIDALIDGRSAAPLLEWAPLVVVADTALVEVSLWV